MTQPTHLIGSIYAVEVPTGMSAFKIECLPDIDFYELDCYELGEYDEPVNEKSISLPPGNWQIICTTKECTPEQAKEIVTQYGRFFIDFTATEQDWKEKEVNWFDNALDSLRSLLQSKNLDTNKNYIIIKNVS